MSTDEREEAARRYVEQLLAFHAHAGMFAIGVLVMFAVNLLTNLSAGLAGDWSAWWSAWALIGWGAGIAVHGLVVRLNRPSLASSTWEQRLIQNGVPPLRETGVVVSSCCS
ncbi:MAG: 2TM domain-containing protein [Acidimicrobiales bacterium]|nr:2TM domain-containing protein [Acidimicrobiales bacterium]